MNVSLELKVSDGLELPLPQSELLVRPSKEMIVPSRLHLVDRKFAGEVKIGTLSCKSDTGDRAECDLHIASKSEGTGANPTKWAGIRLILKAGSHSLEYYAWPDETLY